MLLLTAATAFYQYVYRPLRFLELNCSCQNLHNTRTEPDQRRTLHVWCPLFVAYSTYFNSIPASGWDSTHQSKKGGYCNMQMAQGCDSSWVQEYFFVIVYVCIYIYIQSRCMDRWMDGYRWIAHIWHIHTYITYGAQCWKWSTAATVLNTSKCSTLRDLLCILAISSYTGYHWLYCVRLSSFMWKEAVSCWTSLSVLLLFIYFLKDTSDASLPLRGGLSCSACLWSAKALRAVLVEEMPRRTTVLAPGTLIQDAQRQRQPRLQNY